MSERTTLPAASAAFLTIAVAVLGGCAAMPQVQPGSVAVPEPIDLTLPHEITIHSFTGMAVFDEIEGVQGLKVLVAPKDSFGDPTKAFGSFRFELFTQLAGTPNPKGSRIAQWDVSIMEPKDNRVHWNDFSRAYEFRLQMPGAVPVGQGLILQAAFSSPFTQRIFTERAFLAGE